MAGMGIRANAGTNLGSNAPGATGSSTDENPLQNEMSLSSEDLEARPDASERGGTNNLKKTVLFRNSGDTLSGAQVTGVQGWIGNYTSGDSNADNDTITLRGFASSAGNAADNRTLVDRRIASVQSAITGAGVPAARIRTDNRSSDEAGTVAQAGQANERRVEIRIGNGERQNTVTHEFGHVFGLADEYAEGGRTAGRTSWQDSTVKAAGVAAGSQIENNDGVISIGNQVRSQHYATFAWALNQLTSGKIGSRVWHVKQ